MNIDLSSLPLLPSIASFFYGQPGPARENPDLSLVICHTTYYRRRRNHPRHLIAPSTGLQCCSTSPSPATHTLHHPLHLSCSRRVRCFCRPRGFVLSQREEELLYPSLAVWGVSVMIDCLTDLLRIRLHSTPLYFYSSSYSSESSSKSHLILLLRWSDYSHAKERHETKKDDRGETFVNRAHWLGLNPRSVSCLVSSAPFGSQSLLLSVWESARLFAARQTSSHLWPAVQLEQTQTSTVHLLSTSARCSLRTIPPAS